MSDTDDWSPDESLGTETFESWDEALDEQDEVQPDAFDDPEGDRELDSQLTLDDTETEELGGQLDNPEQLAVLDGGIDDPDGVGQPSAPVDDAGWDLDAAERTTADDLDATDDELDETEILEVANELGRTGRTDE
jgi:hypothetical protein